MRQLFPALRPCDISEVYAGVRADGAAERVLLNVVTTVDGRAAVGGGSRGIGSHADRQLMRQLRAASDAVISGAGTVRGEGMFSGLPSPMAAERERAGRTRQPLSVLVAGRRPVHLSGALARLGPDRLVAFLPQQADPGDLDERATVYTCGVDAVNPHGVVHILRERHRARLILLEGGPTLYGAFLRAGLVDEVFWTIAPKLAGGGEAPGMTLGPPLAELKEIGLLSVYEHGGELYLRYCVH